jgi:peptide/nickel transport system substrate-binding protein
MDTTAKPFDNLDVRLAMKYALDRDDILRKVFLGEAKKGNDTPVASAMPFFKDPTPQFDYNIEKAKEHLAKAGLKTLDVDLSVSEAAFRARQSRRCSTRSTLQRPASTSISSARQTTATGKTSG